MACMVTLRAFLWDRRGENFSPSCGQQRLVSDPNSPRYDGLILDRGLRTWCGNTIILAADPYVAGDYTVLGPIARANRDR